MNRRRLGDIIVWDVAWKIRRCSMLLVVWSGCFLSYEVDSSQTPKIYST
jgi:hypothetical protein